MIEPCSISQQNVRKQLEYIIKDQIATHTILFNLKWLYFLSGITIQNNIILLITQSHLSVTQASSSFKHLDTHTTTYTTPTFITEAFRLVTYVQLFFKMIVKVKSWLTQHQLTLIRLVSMMRFNCKATSYKVSFHDAL